MSQFFPFSLFASVEGTSAVKSAPKVAGTQSTGNGISFEKVLAGMLQKAGSPTTTLSTESGLGFAPATMEAIPFSLLYPEIEKAKGSGAELTVPPEALKQDEQGRLLVSVRHLSAMIEKMNQASGDTQGNTEKEKLLGKLGMTAGDGDSLDRSLLALDAEAQIKGVDTNAGTENGASEKTPDIQLDTATVLKQMAAQGKTASDQQKSESDTPKPADLQLAELVKTSKPAEITPTKPAPISEASEQSIQAALLQKANQSGDKEISDLKQNTVPPAELVVDEKGEAFIAFTLPKQSSTDGTKISDPDKAPVDQYKPLAAGSLSVELRAETKDSNGAVPQQPSQNTAGLSVAGPNTDEQNVDAPLERDRMIAAYTKAVEEAQVRASEEQLQKLVEESAPVKDSTVRLVSAEPASQAASSVSAKALPIKNSDTEAARQNTNQPVHPVEFQQDPETGLKKVVSAGDANTNADLTNKQQTSSDQTQNSKGVKFVIHNEDLPKDLQQEGRKLTLFVKEAGNGSTESAKSTESIKSTVSAKSAESTNSTVSAKSAESMNSTESGKSALSGSLKSLADRFNVQLSVEKSQIDQSKSDVKASPENSQTSNLKADTEAKPSQKSGEAPVTPENIAINKAEMDRQAMEPFTKGYERYAEMEYKSAEPVSKQTGDREMPPPSQEHAAARPQSDARVMNTQTSSPAQSSARSAEPKQVVEQVVRGVSGSISEGRSHVTIRLNPPDLGTVNVKLVLENGTLTARITAEQSATRSLLDQHSHALRQSLTDHGIKVDQVVVTREPAERNPLTQHDRGHQSNERFHKDREDSAGDNRREGNHPQDERQNRGQPKQEWRFSDYFA